MEGNCCCQSSLNKLKNTHYHKLPIDAILLKDEDGYGIIIFDQHTAIACFDINYCPICGRKLNI